MQSKLNRLWASAFLAIAALFTSMSAASANVQKPLRVVASFSILADMTKQVGGEHVQVQSLVGPNSDAHVFDPSPRDAKALAQADVVVINGLGFEGWMDRLIKSSGFKGVLVVATEGIKPLESHEQEHLPATDKHDHKHDHEHDHKHDHGDADPHAWQDLRNGVIYAQNIAVGLMRARPALAKEIGLQTQQYVQQIKLLDQKARAKLDEIPKEQRRVISSHDSFQYFAKAYDVQFLGLQGWTTEREVSAADMAKLVREIRQDKVRALFVENMSDSRLLQRVAQEAGAKVGGKLYSDALSPPGTAADTYLKMFSYNVDQIWMALQQ